MVRRLIEALFSIPTGWAVAAVIAVSSLETALFFGFFLPGESAVFLGGVIASRGRVPLAWILVASVAGPILGDVTGYFLARRFGEEFVRRKLKKKWGRAHRWLSKNRRWAVFTARFVPFVRTVLPSTAGAIRISPAKFLIPDFAAVVVWGVGTALTGYLSGRHYEKVWHWFSRVGWALAAAAALIAVLFLVRRALARRKRRSPRRSRGRSFT